MASLVRCASWYSTRYLSIFVSSKVALLVAAARAACKLDVDALPSIPLPGVLALGCAARQKWTPRFDEIPVRRE